jgi:hypothetical protein
MKTLRLEVEIPPSRELRVMLPDDVPTGRRTVTLVIDAPTERAALDLPVHDFGPWPANVPLRREGMYGDAGR